MNQRIATGFVRSGNRSLSKHDWSKRLKACWLSTDSNYQFTPARENESQVAFTPAVLESTVLQGPSSTVPGWKVVLDGVYAVAFFGFSFALCAWLIFQLEFSLVNFWL